MPKGEKRSPKYSFYSTKSSISQKHFNKAGKGKFTSNLPKFGRKKGGSTFKAFIESKQKNRKLKKLMKWKTIAKDAHLVTPSRFQIVAESDFSQTPKTGRAIASAKLKKHEESFQGVAKNQPPMAHSASPFKEIAGIPKSLLDILASTYKFLRLSEIQKLGIPSILRNHSTLLAAETGTGKTLAYLIPILAKLKLDENQAPPSTETPSKRDTIISPKSLIIAPTRELALQIISIVKLLAKQYHLRSGIILPGYTKVFIWCFHLLRKT